MNEMADFLKAMEVPRKKPVRKPKPVQGKYDLKKLYFEARRIGFQRNYPQSYADGYYYDKDYPDITTTNGTQRYIQDVIDNLGHHAERVNTMGIPQVDALGSPIIGKDGKQKYRKSGATKGSADIPCEIKIPSQPKPAGWKIEVKKGNDDLSKAQLKYKAKMDRVGVFHSIIYVGQLDHFWDEYYKIMKS